MKKDQQQRLDLWQQRMEEAETYWAPICERMDQREKLYQGSRAIKPIVESDPVKETTHLYNIVAENIETIVDSTIPMPKVTPRREKDEHLARIIEHMIRNELDRMPSEENNDLQERICPVQGGTFYYAGWDDGDVSADRRGEIFVDPCHPKMARPQPGVFTGVEDMDWFGMKIPDTKEHIRRVYGVNVDDESESDPAIKGAADEASTQTYDDLVTRNVMYYRNEDGGIGKFSWVNNQILEDMEDCLARHKRRCAKCGALENTEELIMERATLDGTYPEGGETGHRAQKGVCPYCGAVNKWEDSQEDYMEIMVPTMVGGPDGEMIGGSENQLDEFGNVVRVATEQIPYYNPRIYPVVLQRNVSQYGQLLGSSDVDKIEDQQNSMNRLNQKILNRILDAGTLISLPDDTKVTVDPKDTKVIRLQSIEDKNYIDTYDFSGDLSSEMVERQNIYQESRNTLGVTDSYQGRQDATATSGKAKEFAAKQSAGRMASKRVMKNAAYAHLFELIFKLKLAFSDEPRPIYYQDEHGRQMYEEFNPLDFLRRNKNGEWEWNTDFLFSVDDTGGLAGNREALWRETTAQFQSGAMGDPADIDTLIDYWAAMEELHYPTSGKRKEQLMARKKEKLRAAMMAKQVMPPMAPGTQQAAPAPAPAEEAQI